ncbi:MAG: hypothetical protein RIB98_02785 [Acidimicrobiales bacterium]
MGAARDWTRSQHERCPDCGTDASNFADRELGAQVLREVAEWGRLLASADPAAVRRRPAAEVWSPLEYACHVRDLLPVMAGRVELMRTEDSPDLGWWDHEAEVVASCYNEQVPVLVVEQMTTNARGFSLTLDRVVGDEWERRAERRPGEVFTIRGTARFVLHEVIHHRDDASRALKGIAP